MKLHYVLYIDSSMVVVYNVNLVLFIVANVNSVGEHGWVSDNIFVCMDMTFVDM